MEQKVIISINKYFNNYRFNKVDVKERIKPIIDQAFESYHYVAENYQENGEKANSLAAKIRDVIQNSGKIKRYKLNVQVFLGEKKKPESYYSCKRMVGFLFR